MSHVNVWQNQHSIAKQNKVKIKIKKIKKKKKKENESTLSSLVPFGRTELEDIGP